MTRCSASWIRWSRTLSFRSSVRPARRSFRQVAPFDFAHPIDALRRYPATHDINTADHGVGLVTAVMGAPESGYGGPVIVPPTQGAGPAWLKRELVPGDTRNMS